jgi:hypothetical protein
MYGAPFIVTPKIFLEDHETSLSVAGHQLFAAIQIADISRKAADFFE